MSGAWPTPHEWLRKVLRTFGPYDYVRTAVGLLLLTAAALKIHELLTRPVSLFPETGLFSARWVQIAVIETELLLGVCLFVGVWRSVVWLATLLLFGVFAVISLFKLYTGADTCGCFGAVELAPHLSFLVDTCVLFGMFTCRPELNFARQSGAGGPYHVALGTLVFVPLMALILAVSKPAITVAEEGVTIIDDRYATAEPSEWVGKRFPLLRYIDIRGDLEIGDWIIVLYRTSCPNCKELLDAAPGVLADSSIRVAFIEIPPYADRTIRQEGKIFGRLTDKFEWIIAAPVTVGIRDGFVTDRGLSAREHSGCRCAPERTREGT